MKKQKKFIKLRDFYRYFDYAQEYLFRKHVINNNDNSVTKSKVNIKFNKRHKSCQELKIGNS